MTSRLARCLFCAICTMFPLLAYGQSRLEVDSDIPKLPTESTQGERSSQMPDLSRVESIIVQRTNQFRTEQGLPEVERNSKLAEAAGYFAEFMARTSKYGHTADGQQPSERAAKHDYEYCIVNENIAYRYHSMGFASEQLGEGFVEGWKTSPDHRQNMLDPDVLDTGVAVAHDQQSGNYFAVQMFGRPKSKSIQFAVTNQADEEIEYQIVRDGSDKSYSLPSRARRTHFRCRPSELRFLERDEAVNVKVADGTDYVVEQKPSGSLHITKQQMTSPNVDDQF